MNKKEFRKSCMLINAGITDKYKKSALICDKLINYIKQKEYKIIGVYASTINEVNTDDLICKLFDCGYYVALPKVEGNIMNFYYINSLSDLNCTNIYNIREPKINDNLVSKEDMEAMIIPGVAFDTNKNRLGHGAGYYDKFLYGFTGEKIGICFNEQLYDSIPFDEHDVKMDILVTDTSAIE